jgi:hypothetical protein
MGYHGTTQNLGLSRVIPTVIIVVVAFTATAAAVEFRPQDAEHESHLPAINIVTLRVKP